MIQGAYPHLSSLGSSSGAAGSIGQDPNEPLRDVSHLTMVTSDENEFANDPHQIIPTKDIFALPSIPRQGIKGFNHGYLLPAQVEHF